MRTWLCVAVLLTAGCSGASSPGSAPGPAGTLPNASSRQLLADTAVAQIGAAPDSVAAAVTVSNVPGPAISRLVLGANMANWYDITQSGIAASLVNAGFTATRWPGGSESDLYHWQTNSLCAGGYSDVNSTFDNFMQQVAVPAALDVAVTLNYGSNAACNGGGDPTEAAAWVAEAKNAGYPVHTWTVGNEVYGSWEYDLHAKPNNPATYASAVASGYYPDIKAQDASAQVGVVVSPGGSWDSTVLSNARYDFVEYHYYAQAPGSENDATLLANGPQQLTQGVNAVKSDLAAAGHPDTPIYVGELGSVYANPGKQSTSIVQALFAGMAVSELMNDGVSRATWWLAYGGCSDSSSGNFSSSLYGWQNFGGYMIVSDGTPEYGCSNATAVPRGTLLPTAQAYKLLVPFAQDGEHSLATSVASVTLPVQIAGIHGASSVTVHTYGKAQYDLSQNNVWHGSVYHEKGPYQGKATFTLPPWSMTVAIVRP
jgi:hypothetical protein